MTRQETEGGLGQLPARNEALSPIACEDLWPDNRQVSLPGSKFSPTELRDLEPEAPAKPYPDS